MWLTGTAGGVEIFNLSADRIPEPRECVHDLYVGITVPQTIGMSVIYLALQETKAMIAPTKILPTCD